LTNTQAKIAETTRHPVDKVTVTPVSSQAKLDYLRHRDLEDLELSNFPKLEQRIWSALDRRRTVTLLGDALNELDSSLQALLEPLQAEQCALRVEAPDKVAKMSAEADEREREYSRLDSSASEWRTKLNQQLNDCRRELVRTARSRIEEIWDAFNADYLYQDKYLDDPLKLLKQLTDQASLVMGEINQLAMRRVARIQQDLADASGLAIQQRKFAELPPPPIHHLHIELAGSLKQTPDGTAMRKLHDSLSGASWGATAGGTLGTLICPGVGTAIGSWLGGLVGAGAGYRTAVESIQKLEIKARRQSLKAELSPLKRSQLNYVEDAIETLMAEYSVAVTAELRSRLIEAKQSVRDEMRRLRNASAATQQETARRLSELGQEIRPLSLLRSQIAVMATEIIGPRITETVTVSEQVNPAVNATADSPEKSVPTTADGCADE
jgi:hypothetical protein